MNWFLDKKGYLVLLGLLSISPIIALAVSSFFYRSWRILSALDNEIVMFIIVLQIIASVSGCILSLHELKKNMTEHMRNKITGLVLSSSILIQYATLLILLIEIFR